MSDRDGSTVPGCVDSDPRVFDTEGLRVINAPGMPFEGCIPDLHQFRHKRMLRPSAINAWSPGRRLTVLNPCPCSVNSAMPLREYLPRLRPSLPRTVKPALFLTPAPCSLLNIHFLLTFALHLRDMPLSGRLYGSYTVQPTRVGQERGIANEEHANYPGASGKSPVLH